VETARRLREEHERMRRLLRVLAREAAALEPGEKVDPGLMFDVLRYLIEYPVRYHHPIENLALWRLVQHGRIARPLADELDFERRSVRHYGGQLLRLLEGARGDILVPTSTPVPSVRIWHTRSRRCCRLSNSNLLRATGKKSHEQRCLPRILSTARTPTPSFGGCTRR
jgi:hemerythrin-like domain-containing protein